MSHVPSVSFLPAVEWFAVSLFIVLHIQMPLEEQRWYLWPIGCPHYPSHVFDLLPKYKQAFPWSWSTVPLCSVRQNRKSGNHQLHPNGRWVVGPEDWEGLIWVRHSPLNFQFRAIQSRAMLLTLVGCSWLAHGSWNTACLHRNSPEQMQQSIHQHCQSSQLSILQSWEALEWETWVTQSSHSKESLLRSKKTKAIL